MVTGKLSMKTRTKTTTTTTTRVDLKHLIYSKISRRPQSRTTLPTRRRMPHDVVVLPLSIRAAVLSICDSVCSLQTKCPQRVWRARKTPSLEPKLRRGSASKFHSITLHPFHQRPAGKGTELWGSLQREFALRCQQRRSARRHTLEVSRGASGLASTKTTNTSRRIMYFSEMRSSVVNKQQ